MSHANEPSHAMTRSCADRRCQPTRSAAGLAALTRYGLLVLLISLPHAGMAAEPPNNQADLTGLADATMGVSQVTAEGVQCGLEPGQIGEAARQVVAAAGIALRDDSTNRMVISAVTTRVGTDQCATAVLLGVYAKESFFSALAGWVQSGYVVLWQRSLMVATPVGQHAAAMIDATRRLSDQMLLDWRARNPPPAAAAAHGTNAQTGTKVQAGNGSQMATQAPAGVPKVTQ